MSAENLVLLLVSTDKLSKSFFFLVNLLHQLNGFSLPQHINADEYF